MSKAFTGTQAVTWALNNSGRPLRYAAPNGAVESLGDDRMDVWVGREKVFDEILATHPEGRITDLKWFWSQGSGVTRFDHFEMRTLDDVGDASGASATVAGDPPRQRMRKLPRPRRRSPWSAPRPIRSPAPCASPTRFRAARPRSTSASSIWPGAACARWRAAHRVAGQYEVRWDGLGDDGKRVKHGVYFLRAEVGSARRVSRVVYLSE